MATNRVPTECAECFLPVTVDVEALTITATLPSNGIRGSKHVPARKVTEDAALDSDGTLVLWDCPACGYADSTYADPATRKALA